MPTRSADLRYAVRVRVLAKYFGYLLLMLAALTTAPLIFSLLGREMVTGQRYGVLVLGLGCSGALLSRMPEQRHIQPNEAMVLGCLMFLFSPLLMTFPLTSTGLGFVDALFEAASGVTTTGLSTFASVEEMPLSLLFSRSWMQWYGGLGIVFFSVALVVRPGVSAKALAMPEGREDSSLLGGTHNLFRRVLLLYVGITVMGIALLLAGGLAPLSASTYVMSAVSTGGFAPNDGSLAGIGWFNALTLTMLTAICAVPLTSYLGVRLKGLGTLFKSVQIWGVLGLGLLSSLVLFLLLPQPEISWSGRALHSLIMAFSAQTTSGFSSIDTASIPPPAKGWLIVTMFIGGGMGSTAGGLKILRLLIFFKVIGVIVNRASLSRHAVFQPSIQGVPLKEAEMREALAVIILYVAAAVFSWIPFLLYGYDPLDALFEVVSALGTVGLSTGVTGSDLPDLLKGVLCADMLLGRLEIMVWLVLFFPGTWIGRHSEE